MPPPPQRVSHHPATHPPQRAMGSERFHFAGSKGSDGLTAPRYGINGNPDQGGRIGPIIMDAGVFIAACWLGPRIASAVPGQLHTMPRHAIPCRVMHTSGTPTSTARPPWMEACWKKLSGSWGGSALMAVMAWMYRSCRERGNAERASGCEVQRACRCAVQLACPARGPAAQAWPACKPPMPCQPRSPAPSDPCPHPVLG